MLSLVTYTNKLVVGFEIALRSARVILGINSPLFVDDTSSIAEGCAAVPVVLTLTCPFDESAKVTNSNNAIVFKSDTCFFMMLCIK